MTLDFSLIIIKAAVHNVQSIFADSLSMRKAKRRSLSD